MLRSFLNLLIFHLVVLTAYRGFQALIIHFINLEKLETVITI